VKNFFSEFKTFAMRGNVVDLAIGIVIGGAFGAITTSLIGDVIMPVIGIVLGGVDFQNWAVPLPNLYHSSNPPVMYPGRLINAVINFIVIALVVFLIVKIINRARARQEAEKEPEAPPEPTKEELLLTEIRDILKDK